MQRWLRRQWLAGWHVLPDHTAQLTALRDAWRASTGPAGLPDYVRLYALASSFMKGLYFMKWQNARVVSSYTGRHERRWSYRPTHAAGASVESPYANDWVSDHGLETDHGIGSTDGENLWLDRWFRAKRDFAVAWHHVEGNALMRRLRAGAQETVDTELRLALGRLQAEFAALYALSKGDPAAPLPDTSLVGMDVRSKWYTGGTAFGVVRPGGGRALLSDPQGVQRQFHGPDAEYAEYPAQLDSFARVLASMPGDFGGFEARIEAKLAEIAQRQVRAIGGAVGEGRELFRRV